MRQLNDFNRKNIHDLKILILDHNHITFDDFCEILSNLCTNRHLQFLSLESNRLNVNNRDMAINQVRINKFKSNSTYIMHLDVSNNKMNENFCNRLFDCITNKDN